MGIGVKAGDLMNQDEEKFSQIALEAYRASKQEEQKPRRRAAKKPAEPPKEEQLSFSKKLIIFACVVYIATWSVAVLSWFWLGLVPDSLLELGTATFGVAISIYGLKSGAENVTKIKNDDTAG